MVEQTRRRTTRVLLKVPIEVNGTGANGDPFQERTSTVMVDGHGAQIVLKSSPRPGECVTITNLRSRKSCPFRIVRRVTKSLSEDAEWAVECLQPGASFWGIHFPPAESAAAQESPSARQPAPAAERPPATEPKPGIIEALLACQKCGSRKSMRLTVEQYRILSRQHWVRLDCPKCGTSTEWRPSYLGSEGEAPHEPLPSIPSSSPRGGIEKRKAKRLDVKLPIRIRWEDGHEEITNTENLSKTGVCFTSETKMSVGSLIQVTVGYTGQGRHTELRGRIVRRHELEGTNQTKYGVHLEESA